MTAKNSEIVETQQEPAGSGVPQIDSKYRLILIAAQRTKQLQRGAQSRTSFDTKKHKATTVALQEVKEGKIKFKVLDN
ncbi:MAG TPA: DNA-directed RNA polymerase subunit omega [Pyrinomonadaceae bacterium]|jgi:DNA-directed RNA polymerase subunit omega|nr:DNA-directed RNA polymerase subunit omega [Pyrinomonadaceae bacterium]